MSLAAPKPFYNANHLDPSKRKQLAFKSLAKSQTITQTAQEHNVSRKFVYQQKSKAMAAVNEAFEPSVEPPQKVLFYLPVTLTWLCQLILCLVLHCRANHRGVQKVLLDAFDHKMSLGSIHNIIKGAKAKAKVINEKQDLRNIKLAALDETFHHNKPVLTGVDIHSLYCFLLSSESHRDFDTWATHLLDLEQQGLKPERFFGDDADSIRSAQRYVYPSIPYDLDNFHIIKDLMEMRRFFRNRLKSTVTNRETITEKLKKAKLADKIEELQQQRQFADTEEKEMNYLSRNIDTLVSWMQHDVLNMPGLAPVARYELFDFVLEELNQLAVQHPHRIQSVCTSLTNQKYFLLAFTEVLNEKFQVIADKHVLPLEKIWEMCALQRCQHSSDTYAVRSLALQDYFGDDFDKVEEEVIAALDSTERTSSMVENLHSRIKPYFNLRHEIGFDYLELLRFYLNHTPFQRSSKETRKDKTPAEILTGKPHEHWLQMLGFQCFKRAA